MRHQISIILITFFLTISIKSPSQALDDITLAYKNLYFKQLTDSFALAQNEGMSITFQNIDSVRKTTDLLIDFHFSKKALKILKKDLIKRENIYDENLKLSRDSYINNSQFIFKNIKWKWDYYSRILYSDDTLTLVGISNQQINKKIPGKIVFNLKNKNLQILLQARDSLNYFFKYSYESDFLLTFSENKEYNQMINRESSYKRARGAKEGKESYFYQICSSVKVLADFEKFIKEIHLGIVSPVIY